MNNFVFGDLLKGFRNRAGLSQGELGDKLHVSRTTVSNWERGNYLPEIRDDVLTIAKELILSEKETDELLFAAQYPLEHKTSVPQIENADDVVVKEIKSTPNDKPPVSNIDEPRDKKPKLTRLITWKSDYVYFIALITGLYCLYFVNLSSKTYGVIPFITGFYGFIKLWRFKHNIYSPKLIRDIRLQFSEFYTEVFSPDDSKSRIVKLYLACVVLNLWLILHALSVLSMSNYYKDFTIQDKYLTYESVGNAYVIDVINIISEIVLFRGLCLLHVTIANERKTEYLFSACLTLIVGLIASFIFSNILIGSALLYTHGMILRTPSDLIKFYLDISLYPIWIVNLMLTVSLIVNPLISKLEAEISLNIIFFGLLSFGIANIVFNLMSSLPPDFKNSFIKDAIFYLINHRLPTIILATSTYLVTMGVVLAQFLLVETEAILNFGTAKD